ncbi:type II toxin-antitoxin system RelE/ParE family toxin [Sorangium sp. So ce321]|uniref:type II toxin-antitoxin system RelE/ParE family toxin n=1 Tax=Sorangium sp. So ce321 TaxID=3133300 RepID=UPI003F63BC4C
MRIALHPEARAELRAAALWYEERRSGLGDELVAEVSSAFDRIGEAPASFPVWPGTAAAPLSIRRATVSRFPYVIAFEVHADHVLVLAIPHAKRRPLYWLARAL